MAAQAVFTWEAAVAIAYTALWNLGLYLFNTRSPVWRRCSHLNISLVSNKKLGHVAGPPQTWFGWDLICAKDLVSVTYMQHNAVKRSIFKHFCWRI
jgi:hypothetical protein